MPKEKSSKEICKPAQRKPRVRFAEAPDQIHWQVVGAGAPGSTTSLLLYTNTQSYWFNCGEGSQRVMSQQKTKGVMAGTEHIFITNNTWRNMGGLPGLCLTVRAFGCRGIVIHGPPGVMDIYDATKGYVTLSEFNVNSFKEDKLSDHAVDITEVNLQSTATQHPPGIHESWKAGPDIIEGPYGNQVQAYVCTFKPRSGKMVPEKMVEAGVPVGPLYGRIKAGHDVTLDDGRVVRAADMLLPSYPATASLVIELPDITYLDALEAAPQLRDIENLRSVFHFTPAHVVASPRYRAWMGRLSAGHEQSVQHVFLNDKSHGNGLTATNGLMNNLSLVCPQLFPALQGSKADPKAGFSVANQLCSELDGLPTVQATAGLKVYVRPERTPAAVLEEELILDGDAFTEDTLKGTEVPEEDREEYVEGLQKDLELCWKRVKETITESPDSSKLLPEVTFLGTGSSMPGKYRNVSCILVETQSEKFIMLDCGEGSLGQLYRQRDKEGAQKALRNLKAIYISHQHSDHHLGCVNLILDREAAFAAVGQPVEKLYIIVTSMYQNFLTTYHAKIQPVLTNAHFIPCEHLVYFPEVPGGEKKQKVDKSVLNEFLDYAGLSDIETCKAIHCAYSFCISLKSKDGYKISYSGDTRPNHYFVNMGRDSDLLIHEATLEHIRLEDAKLKKHSTFTEAIQVGNDMGAKYVLLTHFSQRYAKIPLLDEIEGHPNVGVAFDNMAVNPSTLDCIQLIFPVMKRLFWAEISEMKENSELLQYQSNPSETAEIPGLAEAVSATLKNMENIQKKPLAGEAKNNQQLWDFLDEESPRRKKKADEETERSGKKLKS